MLIYVILKIMLNGLKYKMEAYIVLQIRISQLSRARENNCI